MSIILLFVILLLVILLLTISAVIVATRKTKKPSSRKTTNQASLLGCPVKARFTSRSLRTSVTGGVAQDLNLVNPWGIASVDSAEERMWIANNQSGVLELYEYTSCTGIYPGSLTLLSSVVATGPVTPPLLTGVVTRTSSTGFLFTSVNGTGPATVITVSEDGLILAYNPTVGPEMVVMVDLGLGGNFKGCEIFGDFLYVSNAHSGFVEVYNNVWTLVQTFRDPDDNLVIVQGWKPYNLRVFHNLLYVVYAANNGSEDEIPNPGNSLIDIFETNGTFVRRFATFDNLNAPWGLRTVDASSSASGQEELIVANFGDGALLRYNLATGEYYGQLTDAFCNPLRNTQLWDLLPLLKSSPPGQFLLTLGIAEESAGLLVLLSPVKPKTTI